MTLFTSMVIITHRWRPPQLLFEQYEDIETLSEFVGACFILAFFFSPILNVEYDVERFCLPI